MRSSVVINTSSGQAVVGGILVAVSQAGSRGELQIGGSQGPILRPLMFGERIRIVAHCVGTLAALDSLCSSILQAATVQTGEADVALQEILALMLAGADQEAPPF